MASIVASMVVKSLNGNFIYDDVVMVLIFTKIPSFYIKNVSIRKNLLKIIIQKHFDFDCEGKFPLIPH